jgi:hypothetical protein
MARSWFLSLGILLAIAVGTALWLRPGSLPAWLPELGAEEEPAVLVLLVGDRHGVASVRAAVAPERVVAATPDAVALEPGRIVATSPEAAGEPLMQAGWAERSIEIWTARPVEPSAQPLPVAQPGAAPPVPHTQATLSPGEAMALLRELEATP